VGEGRVVPVEVGNSYVDEDWSQQIIPFRDFLARAGFSVVPETQADYGPLYLAQHPLFKQFPELERDIILPDYVWNAHQGDYKPPDNESGILVNVWVGSGNGEVVSPAHTVRLNKHR
jgi:hypothetical protein